jgi:hypothetical protein
MEGGGDRSSWLRRGRDGDRSNRLGRGRDGGVDGGGRRGSSPSTRETAAPNPNAREGDVRKPGRRQEMEQGQPGRTLGGGWWVNSVRFYGQRGKSLLI